jgi:hypothetical protein
MPPPPQLPSAVPPCPSRLLLDLLPVQVVLLVARKPVQEVVVGGCCSWSCSLCLWCLVSSLISRRTMRSERTSSPLFTTRRTSLHLGHTQASSLPRLGLVLVLPQRATSARSRLPAEMCVTPREAPY